MVIFALLVFSSFVSSDWASFSSIALLTALLRRLAQTPRLHTVRLLTCWLAKQDVDCTCGKGITNHMNQLRITNARMIEEDMQLRT